MNRWKKSKNKICHCHNCGYNIKIMPKIVKEKTFDKSVKARDTLTATFIECPVCGERLLKQLDTQQTYELAQRGVKLELLKRHGKKLSDKQKLRLKKIEKYLFDTRKSLNLLYWDEIYQLLNQYSETKTGVVNQEPILGSEVTNTVKLGERMAEHV